MPPHSQAPSEARTDCVGCSWTSREATGRTARTAAPGLRLCGSCRDRLILHITEAAHLYRECGEMLSCTTQLPFRERTSGGGAPTGIPFNEAAARIRADLLALLGSWASLVALERNAAAPPRDMEARAAFLKSQVEWLAAHQAAADVCQELAAAVVEARRVARPDAAPGRLHLGPCPEPRCAGELVATAHATLGESPDLVTCTAEERHCWPSRQWTLLVRRMAAARADEGGRQPERWLGVDHIARVFQVSTGTVYRLASEHGWGRCRRGGRTYYRESEVHSVFARRVERAGRG
ncbi:helix-turn-helix domain-containing protein [Streptomyces tailanensis]|uniref:helix-turn-helix domain-containing protein n=1 Tax=Streptomyces tailanensis TaxID=2569858 RepID=UPI00122E9314|nr:helix-turn-helix domain-containing protein [Streptomyces tailanensis]